MSIDENYDICFIVALALREKQIRQNYRPIITVHKWWGAAKTVGGISRKSCEDYAVQSLRGTSCESPFKQ